MLYDGIGTQQGGLVLGRVIEDRGLDAPKDAEPTTRKIRRLRRLLDSHPLPNAAVDLRVASRRGRVRTDKRGYFTWRVAGPLPIGHHQVQATLAGGRLHRVLPGELQIFPSYPAGSGQRGVLWVSDIDDTVLRTQVRHKLRMLKGLLTRNARELQAFVGAAEVMRRGAASGVALAFVSGSPWQLQPRLRGFFRHARLPRAPLFLKRIGFGSDADALLDQGEYKRRQLERLLALLPNYDVVCFGDSGEHDPEVYRALQRRHPKLVRAVLIHDVGGLKANSPRLRGQVRFRRWPQAERWLERHGLLPRLATTAATPARTTAAPAPRPATPATTP